MKYKYFGIYLAAIILVAVYFPGTGHATSIVYSTFLGGDSGDYGWDIAVDSSGSAYITGFTSSINFPTQNAIQKLSGGGSINAFVSKFSPSGYELIYSTYLGGSVEERSYSIAVDDSEYVYLAGYTQSTDFPTINALIKTKPASGLRPDAFVVKIEPSGSSMVYSTFLGGSSSEQAWGVATDWLGNAYVTGYTLSTDFPTMNAYDPVGDAYMDAFVTKLDPTGGALLFSTYLGGRTGREYCYGFDTDTNGNVYVSGMTESTDYPTKNAFQKTHRGDWDGYVTKLNTHGTHIEYSTFLGGAGHDSANSVAVDVYGHAYVAGSTISTNFPTLNAFQPGYGGGNHDAFLTKLHPTGATAIYSTYLGGSSGDFSYGSGFDDYGNGYISGETESPAFPTFNAYDGIYNGNWDAFIAKLDDTGSMLLFSTFLGGSERDQAYEVGIDTSGDLYVTGYTESADFPTLNAYQPIHATAGGSRDAFVTKFSSNIPVPIDVGYPFIVIVLISLGTLFLARIYDS
jgi:hypothetical protein